MAAAISWAEKPLARRPQATSATAQATSATAHAALEQWLTYLPLQVTTRWNPLPGVCARAQCPQCRQQIPGSVNSDEPFNLACAKAAFALLLRDKPVNR